MVTRSSNTSGKLFRDCKLVTKSAASHFEVWFHKKSALFIVRSGHTFDTLHDKPCPSRELRDTTCASQQHDSHICQSRSPHSFVHLRHCFAQLETDQPTSDTSCGCIGNGRKQNDDASSQPCLRGRDTVRQMCGEHVNLVTSSSEAGIRPAHLRRPVCSSTTLSVETSPA